MPSTCSTRRSASWLTGALALVSLLTLTLSACGAATVRTRASIAPTATSTPVPYPTSTPPPPTLTLQQAWGNIHVSNLPVAIPGGAQFFFENAATPDGQWLVGGVGLVNSSPAFTPYIALYNVATHALRRIHDLQSANSSVAGASLNGDWLAWSENCGMAPGPWSLNVYNLRTGVYQQIVSGVTSATASGWASPPVVSQGYVIWSQLPPNTPSSGNDVYKSVEVQLLQLSNGTVTTLATSANGAALAWPWAGWNVVTNSYGGGYIQFKNMESGQMTRFSQPVSYLAMAGSAAVLGFSPGQILLAPDVTQPDVTQRVYFAPSGAEADQATVSDRLIAWFAQSDSAIPQVYDQRLHAYVILPRGYAPATQAWTDGNLLVWDEATTPPSTTGATTIDTLCVVSVSALPTAPAA